MRIRELLGVGLAVALWCFPFWLFLTLMGWVEGDLPGYVFLFTFLVGFAWPGAFLLSRRLRKPTDIDVAEADGRPPVLVIHPPRAPGGALQRLFPTPAFFRDVEDALLMRALERSLISVGPLLLFERPPPPRSHGPIALEVGTEAHEARLRERVRGAALVVNVVDGSEANGRELALTAEAIDVRRIVLVAPPKLDEAFLERWEGLRKRLPGLPAIEATSAAVRFAKDAIPNPIRASFASFASRRAALSRPSELVHEHERQSRPKPPLVSWALSMLPIGAGFVSAVVTPIFLEEHNLSSGNSDHAGWGVVSIALGFALAFMSRRLMRLVPANELPIVLVAAVPWLTVTLVALFRESSLDVNLVVGQGAAFAAPLLLTTALVLAGASLMRRSPGRRPSFVVFGVAAVIPLVALTTSLDDMYVDTGGLLGALLVSGFVLGIAIVAASGDAGRRHAPLSIGAGVCAALAAGGWMAAVAHSAWRHVATGGAVTRGVAGTTDPLLMFDTHGPWLLLALPLSVVAVGLMFEGRSTKTAAGNALTLLPLVLLLSTTAAVQAGGRRHVGESRALAGAEIYASATGGRELLGFELARARYARPAGGPAHIVLDRGGALAEGRRVASAVELSSVGATGGPDLSRAIARIVSRTDDRSVRVAAGRDASAAALATVCRAIWSYSPSPIELMAQSTNREPATAFLLHPLRHPFHIPGSNPPMGILLVLDGYGAHTGYTGGNFGFYDIGRDASGVIDRGFVRDELTRRSTIGPQLILEVRGGASVQDLVDTLSIAQSTDFERLILTDRHM